MFASLVATFAATFAAALTAPQVNAALPRIAALPRPGDRVAAASELFLGAPYTLGPLGEGAPPSPGPLIRFDTFDCVTIVETSLALANAPTSAAVLSVMSDIRYKSGTPRFGDRNHYTEAQWIPSNVKKGYLKPLFLPGMTPARRVFDHGTWERGGKNLGGIPLSEADYPNGTFAVAMVPLDESKAAFERVPSGTVVLIVRRDDPDKVTRVSHLAIAVERDGRRYVRNASSKYQKVVDETVDEFIARNRSMKSWPVEGFAFYAPQDARARTRQLARVE